MKQEIFGLLGKEWAENSVCGLLRRTNKMLQVVLVRDQRALPAKQIKKLSMS